MQDKQAKNNMSRNMPAGQMQRPVAGIYIGKASGGTSTVSIDVPFMI
jgi:hypothetical protein